MAKLKPTYPELDVIRDLILNSWDVERPTRRLARKYWFAFPKSYRKLIRLIGIDDELVQERLSRWINDVPPFQFKEVQRTASIDLDELKDFDGWMGLAYSLGLTEEEAYQYFEYGEYANITIEVDHNLNIIGGKIHKRR